LPKRVPEQPVKATRYGKSANVGDANAARMNDAIDGMSEEGDHRGSKPRKEFSYDSHLSSTSNTSSRLGTHLRPTLRAKEHMDNAMMETVGEGEKTIKLKPLDKVVAGFFGVGSMGLVIVLCIWADSGLLPTEHIGHVHSTKTRVGHVHSPIFVTPATISLHGTESEVFDVRIIGMAMADFSGHGQGHGASEHRLLSEIAPTTAWRGWNRRPVIYRRLTHAVAEPDHVESSHDPHGVEEETHGAVEHAHGESVHAPQSSEVHSAAGHGPKGGTLTYRLFADGVEFHRKTIVLSALEELEFFETVQVGDASKAKHFSAEVTAVNTDGDTNAAFMMQVLRMSSTANYRFVIGMAVFTITFVSIVAERVHRSYSAAIGASITLCLVAAIQETPELHVVTAMIDWGTLMLLFSMMILMQMLAMTGFFNWFALKVIVISKEDPKSLFFLLTNCCGAMSMVLDNVTCVLLTGPLMYQIAKKMQLNPRPYFLAMTVCATVGGTATLIGDPPNIVIGMKLKLGFETFLAVNFPIVAVVLLPLSSVLLYLKFKTQLCQYTEKPPPLDIKALAEENRIRDEPMFAELGSVLFAVLLALLSSPLHKIEPAWFTVYAMFACALRFDRHHMGKWLELVEWDTLFFFALLFVLVEALSELGVIRTLGMAIMSLITVFPEEVRMYAAIIIILWVSGIGSAFLESLPYTATMVYIIQDLMGQDIPGVDVPKLIWPLSIGACVGGIGSIMGSSANLVCMAISERNASCEEEKVQSSDFICSGFPVLLVLLVCANIWLIFLLIWCGVQP